MIVHIGIDGAQGDEAAQRAAKLKALQTAFNDQTSPVAINLLNGAITTRKPKKERLILNSHGNQNNFAGLTAKQLFDKLVQQGVDKDRFSAIYLVACNCGLQAQDNSVAQTFANDFAHLVKTNQNTSAIKIYAPRGLITYDGKQESVNGGGTYWTATVKGVQTPEKLYTFEEGFSLVV